MANRVVWFENGVFVSVGGFTIDTSWNSLVPLCTHLNQERANVYHFHTQGWTDWTTWAGNISPSYPFGITPLIQCEKKDHLKWTYNARNFWTKTVGFLFCLSKSSKIWNCLQWSFCYMINPLLTAVYSYGDTLSLTTFFIHQSGV